MRLHVLESGESMWKLARKKIGPPGFVKKENRSSWFCCVILTPANFPVAHGGFFLLIKVDRPMITLYPMPSV